MPPKGGPGAHRGDVPMTPTTSRRRLLRAGGLAALGMNLDLAGLLRAEAVAGAGAKASAPARPTRSCILIFYYGGPSHIDTWDPKPNAPREVRGAFRPIGTRVPGLCVSEHLPCCARVA